MYVVEVVVGVAVFVPLVSVGRVVVVGILLPRAVMGVVGVVAGRVAVFAAVTATVVVMVMMVLVVRDVVIAVGVLWQIFLDPGL